MPPKPPPHRKCMEFIFALRSEKTHFLGKVQWQSCSISLVFYSACSFVANYFLFLKLHTKIFLQVSFFLDISATFLWSGVKQIQQEREDFHEFSAVFGFSLGAGDAPLLTIKADLFFVGWLGRILMCVATPVRSLAVLRWCRMLFKARSHRAKSPQGISRVLSGMVCVNAPSSRTRIGRPGPGQGVNRLTAIRRSEPPRHRWIYMECTFWRHKAQTVNLQATEHSLNYTNWKKLY